MGLRFKKKEKICKGVKVNFSKSGASLSLGGRGHSVNFGGRGTRTTIGIPGTGLTYSSKLGGTHKPKSSHKNTATRSISRSNTVAVPKSVQLKMSPDGRVEIQDENGNVITDQSVVRRIKDTDSYKNMVKNLEGQRQDMLERAYNEAKAENDKFIEIYKSSPQVDRQEQYIQIMDSLRPPVYQRRQYDIPYPTDAAVRELLIQEAKDTVQGNIFTVRKLRKEYVEANLQSRLNAAVYEWNQNREAFDKFEMLMNHTASKIIGIVGIPDHDFLSVFADLAFLRLIEAEEHGHQSGFTGTVLTQQSVDFSLFQLERDVIVGNNAREPFGNMQHFDGIGFVLNRCLVFCSHEGSSLLKFVIIEKRREHSALSFKQAELSYLMLP